ncbi:MAG: hypothetical protein ABJA60_12310 [Nitrosospira sp.]
MPRSWSRLEDVPVCHQERCRFTVSGQFKWVKSYVGTAHVMATIEEAQAEPKPASGEEAGIMNNMGAPQEPFNRLAGYFPFREFPRLKFGVLAETLLHLHRSFERELVNAFNWNWASRQVRGVVWHI